MNRAKEFQRGTAGVLESNKKRRKVLFDETDILLGPSGRGFEPLHSDQKLSEISDFRELFLFLVYCGARGEGEQSILTMYCNFY